MASNAVWQEENTKTKLIGKSIKWREVLENIELVSSTDATVLITGESGTGKELVAQSIHEKSGRKNKPIVKVNCAAISPELFESEFFGHTKGSFTGAVRDRMGRFQMADGGTIFLDEIGEIPLDLQGKLLRVLQEGQFERVGEDKTRSTDVRVIAATNRNLQTEAEAGNFRLDLFYRLNVFSVHIAPLRERLEDIPLLANHFLKKCAERHACQLSGFSAENLEALQNYHYPGNVRELENIIERATILSGCRVLMMDMADIIDSLLLPAQKETIADFLGKEAPKPKILTYPDLKELERDNIIKALKATNYKVYGKEGAAELLETKPTTLASRIKALSIPMRP
jgi:transcriptional regulator with GAF, ATPase, and Fis domain